MKPIEILNFDEPLRVLVVEDSEVDRKMIEAMLTEGVGFAEMIRSTESLEDAINELKSNAFDVVLLDLNLPDSGGEETLRRVHIQFPKMPIVINTGSYEDHLGLQTLRFGAQDFLIKGKYNAYILRKALRYAIERKRLEDRLKEAYQQLTVTQAHLVQAEKMKVVGGLASGVAHEVKNPLATILYGVTYLHQNLKHKDRKTQLVLNNIKLATDQANRIIMDLLDFSHMHKLDIKKGDVNQIIETVLSLVNYQFEQHNIIVSKQLSDALSDIYVDRHRIEQVLINLILNAVFAMPDGGDLRIETYGDIISENNRNSLGVLNGKFQLGEAVIVVTVKDSGSGIPNDQIKNIFDPFFTTRRANGGVGLGLSVSRNIMQTHHGHISLKNQENGGICATLVFKLGDPSSLSK